MIISRTPYRISFFGGGTDFPEWYNYNVGSVLSTSINKYSYITCKKIPDIFNYKFRLRYFKTEELTSLNDIKHPSFRETLKFMKLHNDSIELVHTGELPAGTGLGSSSAFTVGLLNTLYAYKNLLASKRTIALNAIHIEQNEINEHVGSQDQVACCFGGINKINFTKKNIFEVEPLAISAKSLKSLEDHLCLFFTGFTRNSTDIAKHQIQNIKKNTSILRELNNQVDIAVKLLFDNNIYDFAKLLNEEWQLKKQLSSKISSPHVDEAYESALKVGALGGKVIGAGSGGFMIFLINPEYKKVLIEKLSHFYHVPVNFETLGSQIIYFSRQ